MLTGFAVKIGCHFFTVWLFLYFLKFIIFCDVDLLTMINAYFIHLCLFMTNVCFINNETNPE